MADAFIECYEGLLGGGKSYSAVKRMYNIFCDGGTIITNIKLFWDEPKPPTDDNPKGGTWTFKKRAAEIDNVELEDDQYVFIEPGDMSKFHRFMKRGSRGAPVFGFFDEIHPFFNARDWSQTNKESRPLLELLTQARKFHMHIVLITQNRHNLDKQFIRMVQYFWRFRDMQKRCIS